MLALGFALIVSGPLRAILRRPPSTWRRDLPLILSMAFVVSALTFFTQTAHPLANLWAVGTWPSSPDVTELGIVSFLLTTVLLVNPRLLKTRVRIPFGDATEVSAEPEKPTTVMTVAKPGSQPPGNFAEKLRSRSSVKLTKRYNLGDSNSLVI